MTKKNVLAVAALIVSAAAKMEKNVIAPQNAIVLQNTTANK
jgi:hypothetical protein